MTKQLSDNVGWQPIDAPFKPMREVLKVWSYRNALPVTCAQRTGVSHDIGETAQKEAGFMSRLMNGDCTELYAGYELEEGRRQREWEEILPTLAY